jgi:hypothetical protein
MRRLRTPRTRLLLSAVLVVACAPATLVTGRISATDPPVVEVRVAPAPRPVGGSSDGSEASQPARRAPFCPGFNGLDAHNPADEVMAGRFRAPGRRSVRVASGADVDWRLDPLDNISWRLWFHSLGWTGSLIKDFEKRGDRASLRRAARIARDWVTDNPPGAAGDRMIAESAKFRLNTLICLRGHHRASWLDRAIARHAAYLADARHWSGPWNHGTDESRSLLAAGCSIGRSDYIDLAYRRLMTAVFKPPGGARPAIDPQGANNEQSAGYSLYNRALWRRVTGLMWDCGYRVPAELTRRLRLLDEFVAFQVTPAGQIVQIGETSAASLTGARGLGDGSLRYAAARGAAGRPPGRRARVYRAGYVAGRSGWGGGRRAVIDETHYTARFGPGRYAHGQNDHMALTFFAQGRDILVPSGHAGYNDAGWRGWLRSPAAHNTLVVDGAPFAAGAVTRLTGHRFEPGADTFSFADSAYAGTDRRRSVLVAAAPDVMVVLDRARSRTPRKVTQLWHLPADFSAGTDDRFNAVARAGAVRVHFIRVPLPADHGTGRPARVVKGSEHPRQGWVFRAKSSPRPAPVIEMPGTGGDVSILTLIVPTRGTGRPQARLVSQGGRHRVELVTPGGRLSVQLTADGRLRRVG